MNVAFFLKPKANVAYLYEDCSLRQGLEKMRVHGYTAIPVLTRENIYVGTVSEGDFLWHLVGKQIRWALEELKLPDKETVAVRDIMSQQRNPAVLITASIDELMVRAEQQNFIPVVDDRNTFIGIVTRKDILHYYAESYKKQKND